MGQHELNTKREETAYCGTVHRASDDNGSEVAELERRLFQLDKESAIQKSGGALCKQIVLNDAVIESREVFNESMNLYQLLHAWKRRPVAEAI